MSVASFPETVHGFFYNLERVLNETEYLMLPGDWAPTLALLFKRPAWMAEAACRDMAPSLFFPAQGEPTAEAKRICAACSYADPCLEYALETGSVGVWAGTSARERRKMDGYVRPLSDPTSGRGQAAGG